MVTTAKHNTMAGLDMHSIVRWSAATSANLPTPLTADDLHKVAHVVDTDTFLILVAFDPITWKELSYESSNPVVDILLDGDNNIVVTFEDDSATLLLTSGIGSGGVGGTSAILGQLRLVPTVTPADPEWLPASGLEVDVNTNPTLFDAVAIPDMALAYTTQKASALLSQVGISGVGTLFPNGNATAHVIPTPVGTTSPSGIFWDTNTGTPAALDAAADGEIQGFVTNDAQTAVYMIVKGATSLKLFLCSSAFPAEVANFTNINANVTDAALIGKTTNGFELLVKVSGQTNWQFATLSEASNVGVLTINTNTSTFTSTAYTDVHYAVGNDIVYFFDSNQLRAVDNAGNTSTLLEFLNASADTRDGFQAAAGGGKIFMVVDRGAGALMDVYDSAGTLLIAETPILNGQPISDILLHLGLVWVTTRTPSEVSDPRTYLAAYRTVDMSVVLDTTLTNTPAGGQVGIGAVAPYLFGSSTKGVGVFFEDSANVQLVHRYVTYFASSPYTLPTLTPPGAGFRYEVYKGA